MRAIFRKRDFGEKLGIILMLIIPIIIVAAILILPNFIGFDDDGYKFEMADDGSGYVLVRYSGDATNLTIKSKYNGNSGVKSVVAIGEGAFDGCNSLVKVTIPDTVKVIESEAFKNCVNLEDVDIPGSVKVIESGAFENCLKLIDVTLNSGTEKIEENAFKNCDYIAYLNLCDTLSCIEPGAFYGCSRIAYITIPESNKTYHTQGNCIINTEEKTLVVGGRITEIPADGSVTKIGEKAFAGNTKIFDVVIPDTITEICKNAFQNTSITSVRIPLSVSVIGEAAFENCLNLYSVYYAGAPEEWQNICIAKGNLIFESTLRYFDGKNEESAE